MKKLLTIVSMLFLVALSTVVFAQDDVTRKSVNVSGFHAIQASGIASVYLTKGSQEKVEVEINEKYREFTKVSVDDQVLNIKLDLKDRGNRRDYEDLKFKVYVTYKTLDALTGSGATNFHTQNKLTTPKLTLDVSGANNSTLDLDAGELKVEASGAANIKLSGQADKFAIDANGACNIKAYELKATQVKAEVSGVSNAYVMAEKKLDVKADGLSHVNYKGNPQIGVREVSKMSSVHKQ